MSKTASESEPEPQPTSEAAPNRDLPDTELNGVDGGFGVLSVAGSTKKRPIDLRDMERPKIPFF